MTDFDRRKFLQTALAVSTVAGVSAGAADAHQDTSRQRPPSAQSVMNLVVPKMETVRIGLIGVGQRGVGFIHHFHNIEGSEVVAICDSYQPALDQAAKISTDYGQSAALYGGDDYAYRQLLERADIDIVVIATPWRWHAPMATEAMQNGKHAFVEVPAVVSVEEAWKLVDVSEATQKNCMMMENVCYGREELMVLNMVRQGVFGELLHGEAAYIHELRWQMKEIGQKTGSWRTHWHTKRNGNLYPTHGLGPIAQYMNINRGDRFDYMNSMSSPAVGRAKYAKEQFPPQHGRNQLNYINGDINTSMIKTMLGRTIMVQYDTTTPRPYTRHNLIQGTNGVFAGYPNRIVLEEGGSGNTHEWDYDMAPWYKKFDHPLFLRMGQRSQQQGGHGGMDFLMCWRLIYCLRNEQPLDQNVYDAAAWSVVAPLSTKSIAERGNSQTIPDFTRGQWLHAPPLPIVS